MIDLSLVVLFFVTGMFFGWWGFSKRHPLLLIVSATFFFFVAGSFSMGVSYVNGFNITTVNSSLTLIVKNYSQFLDGWVRFPMMISFSVVALFFLFMSFLTKPKVDYSEDEGGE